MPWIHCDNSRKCEDFAKPYEAGFNDKWLIAADDLAEEMIDWKS